MLQNETNGLEFPNPTNHNNHLQNNNTKDTKDNNNSSQSDQADNDQIKQSLGMQNTDHVRKEGFGSFSHLPDEFIFFLMYGYCFEGPLIIARLMQVSHAFWQFASWEPLWKKITLQLAPGNFEFRHSWRFTAKVVYLRSQKEKREKESFILEPEKPLEPEEYSLFSGFYCPHQVRSWYRLTYGIVGVQDSGFIKRIPPFYNLSEEEYTAKYSIPRRPFILAEYCKRWEAFENWKIDTLLARFPNHAIKCAQSNMYGERVVMTVKNYVSYMRGNKDEKPLYIFDSSFYKRIPELAQEYEVPKIFLKDWLSVLNKRRPDFRWFLIGPIRTGTGFHIDPNGTAAWNALLVGRKWWLLYPPETIPPGVQVIYNENGTIRKWKSPAPLKWLYDHYHKITNPINKPIEVIQYAGDMIYVPSGWWHMVINLEETVSVTQNFVNDHNLERATKWIYNDSHYSKILDYWVERLKEVSPPHWERVRNKIRLLDGKHAQIKAEELEKKLEEKDNLLKIKQQQWTEREKYLLHQIQQLTEQLQAESLLINK